MARHPTQFLSSPGALLPQVVRPHFQGVTATAIASHPLLKLGTWDPWRPVGELIGQIKTFLEVCGPTPASILGFRHCWVTCTTHIGGPLPLPSSDHGRPRDSTRPLPSSQAAARVDLDHPMNDIKRFPASSYRPVEVALARLNALSGLDLPCQVLRGRE